MNSKYDWSAISEYSKTHTVQECCNKFGFQKGSWYWALNKRLVEPRPKLNLLSLDVVAVKNSTYKRHNLKARIIKDGLIPHVCESCGLSNEWEGKPLVLILDHKNGVNNDNRLENLRFLCPNCNSQTETFSGRNVKRKKILNGLVV